MQLPDSIYNWVRDFFSNRYHCTRYAGHLSTVADIEASVIQGSGLGPASYVVTAADLHPCTIGNRIFKYADDTYLVVPATNSSTPCLETEQNNLTLNCGKTKEMVIRAGGKRGKLVKPPAPCLDIERVNSIRILGVTINELLSAADHVRNLLFSSNSSLYALRVLRVHGMSDESLQEVFVLLFWRR